MWSLLYTAVSDHYSRLESIGRITDEELEKKLLEMQQFSLEDLSRTYVETLDKPLTSLED
jgi:hypothetical protein